MDLHYRTKVAWSTVNVEYMNIVLVATYHPTPGMYDFHPYIHLWTGFKPLKLVFPELITLKKTGL